MEISWCNTRSDSSKKNQIRNQLKRSQVANLKFCTKLKLGNFKKNKLATNIVWHVNVPNLRGGGANMWGNFKTRHDPVYRWTDEMSHGRTAVQTDGQTRQIFCLAWYYSKHCLFPCEIELNKCWLWICNYIHSKTYCHTYTCCYIHSFIFLYLYVLSVSLST